MMAARRRSKQWADLPENTEADVKRLSTGEERVYIRYTFPNGVR